MSLLGSFFGASETTTQTSNSPLDVITYVASLASKPMEIDALLDPVRAITAKLGPEKILTVSDEDVLAAVYLKIENYLTTKEPLRTFTNIELRSKIGEKFSPKPGAYTTFWEKVGVQVHA